LSLNSKPIPVLRLNEVIQRLIVLTEFLALWIPEDVDMVLCTKIGFSCDLLEKIAVVNGAVNNSFVKERFDSVVDKLSYWRQDD